MPESCEYFLRDATFNQEEASLPFQIYSVGSRVLGENEISYTPAPKNIFVEFQWGISGIGEIEFFDRIYQMRENNVFYWLPGESHHQHALSPQWKTRCLCLDGPLAESIVLSFRMPRHIHAECPPSQEIFDEIVHNIGNHSFYQRGHLACLAMELLVGIRRSVEVQPKSLIENCFQYIRNHYGDPAFCIDTLCDEFQVSRSTLVRLFLRETHLPIGTHIRNVRYGNALALLHNTTRPVHEIAAQCGYLSYPSFCRLIRRGTGLSPVEYRKKTTGTL